MDQRRPPRKGGGSPAPSYRKPADRPRPRRQRDAHPTPRPAGEGEDRLQKVLAHAGIGSRRGCEELILKGRVSIDGQVVRELGTKVDPKASTVAVDGQKIQIEKPVYYAIYKPKGYVSTNSDPSGRPRVLDLIPEIPQRVYTVGRLDEMSVGLMLLTNDGELAHKLAHPKYGVEKLYRVAVAGLPSREVLNQLTEGIWLAEGKVRAKRVKVVGKRGESTILEMVLSEGKNREVRRMLARLGHKVMSLTRIAVGPISIKGLSAGQFRPLNPREVGLLRKAADGEYVPPFWSDRAHPPRQGGSRPARGPSAPSPMGMHRPADARPPVPHPRPGEAQGRPPGPAGRPSGPAMRPAGPASRRPPSGTAPPQGPQRRPSTGGPGPGGPPRRPFVQDGPGPRPPRGPSQDGPPRRPVVQDGPGPRPPRPAPRPRDEERIVPPVGDDNQGGGRGRRIIGMEADGGAPERPRPRPTARRAPKPKPPRRAPGPARPKRPRRDEGGGSTPGGPPAS